MTTTKYLTEDELAYIAGYLDGEGCFYIRNRRQIAIACENTHRPTIEWLHRNFGGSLTSLQNKKKPQWRPTYRWNVVGGDAYNVCSQIIPFMKEKTEQALLLIAYQQTMGTIGKKLSSGIKKERARLEERIKGLKHVRY